MIKDLNCLLESKLLSLAPICNRCIALSQHQQKLGSIRLCRRHLVGIRQRRHGQSTYLARWIGTAPENIADETIEIIANRFNERGVSFGENRNVTGDVAREILRSCV